MPWNGSNGYSLASLLDVFSPLYSSYKTGAVDVGSTALPCISTRIAGIEMLILTRKKGESFLIGDNITVVVSSIKGERVRIGIEAPNNVMIRREELEPESVPRQQDGE